MSNIRKEITRLLIKQFVEAIDKVYVDDARVGVITFSITNHYVTNNQPGWCIKEVN